MINSKDIEHKVVKVFSFGFSKLESLSTHSLIKFLFLLIFAMKILFPSSLKAFLILIPFKSK